jgi:hypothetical protein
MEKKNEREPQMGFPQMTLRDYFAARAIEPLIANGASLGSDEGLAKRAYSVADAMLKAREQCP